MKDISKYKIKKKVIFSLLLWIDKQQTCPKCGKKFLSQPALKEHCKKNHDFNPNINGEVRSRGRPRRDAVKPSD